MAFGEGEIQADPGIDSDDIFGGLLEEGKGCSANDFNNLPFYNKLMYGGMGYGKFCLPKDFSSILILIAFPPLFVFINEYKNGFKRIDRIIINFILTSCFYFPGLLHGLSILSSGSFVNKDKCAA